MGELVQKQKYVYKFVPFEEGMLPLMETQVLFHDDVLEFFKQQETLSEPIMTGVPEVVASLGEGMKERVETKVSEEELPVGEKGKKAVEKKTFKISYVNPVTKRAEELQAETQAIDTGYSQDVVEDAIKTASAYPVYKFVTAPIITTEIAQWKFEEIMKKIEIMSPKPFGGGMKVRIVKAGKEGIKPEVAEAEKAIVAVLERRGEVAGRLDTEIVALEHAVGALREKRPVDEIIEGLPSRLRALLLVRLRKRELDRKIIHTLLVTDINFLKGIKLKLKSMSLKDLINLAKVIKRIKER